VTQGTSEQGRGAGRASARAAAWLAWSVCALSLLMLAVVLMVAFLGWSSPLPRGWQPWQDVAIQTAGFVGAPLLGALIASRRPQNPYGWLWLGLSFGFSLTGLAGAYAAYALFAEPGSLPAPRTVGTTVAVAGWLVGLTCLPLLLLLFPDGRPPSRRWRFVVWADLVAGAVLLIVAPFMPGLSGLDPGFAPMKNPLGIGGVVGDAITTIVTAMVYVLLATVFLSALSLVFRYRRARGVKRQQLKWFALGAALVAALIVTGQLLSFDKLLGNVLSSLFDSATLAGLYVAVGVAILRYRLYDIDVLINRALVYGSLTVMLALVYFGGVTATEAIFRALTGQEKQTQIAVVASTLVIAALFTPLRRRLQSFIDRRFYRSKYDAAKTMAAFNARLRDQTDLNALSNDLVRVVSATVQPAHVSLWLRPDPEPEARSAALRQFGHDE
jgi:hypothetical protein